MQKSCLLGTIFSCYFTLDKLTHRLILVIILIFHVFKIMGTFCKFFKIKILLKYRFHLQCVLSNLIIKEGCRDILYFVKRIIKVIIRIKI